MGVVSLGDADYLISLARHAILHYFEKGEKLPSEKRAGALGEKRGVFVTLKEHPCGELRGCIGHPLPVMPLCDAVIENALASAFSDPRFPQLRQGELQKITIEISVLGVPEKIIVSRPLDYPKKIKIGRDGLIARSGWASGLLLPQVPVEWGWKEEEFLSHACMKAGIDPAAWRRGEVEFSRFSAQVFSEEKPGGKVKEETN